MRVLAVTTRFPAPPWRGDQVRAYHHLRVLARRHEVTLAALCWQPPSAAAREEVAGFGVRIEVVPLGRAGAGPRLVRALLGDPRPLQVLLYDGTRARARVRALVASLRPDVMHLQLVRAAPYLAAGGSPPAVIDLVDALSANLQRRAASDRGWLGPVARIEAARLAAFERQVVAGAASCLVVSEAERDALGGGTVRVVPNGVVVPAEADVARVRIPGRILFAGNLGYFPNVDAARWLAGEILPRVRAAVPDATLRLVGARPSRAVRRLGRSGVTVVGAVASMAPELAAAAVTVVPMRAGSGVQNKVLEAMAAGLPVVTTPRTAAALGARDGEHCLVAEDAAGLADAAIRLLRDHDRAVTIARAAHAFVARTYGWDASAARVEAAWIDACAGVRRAP